VAGVAPLASFSRDWVGGDIRGLQGVAQALYGYVPRVQDLSGRLSVVARGLTSAGSGGWQGQAASAFTAAWQKQALTAAALGEYVTAVAQVIDGLAVQLSQLENALEQQAAAASGRGVQVGADGTVTGYSGVQGLEQAVVYAEVREQAMSAATQARQVAAQQLYSCYQQAVNANPHPSTGDAVTMGGLLADMLAAPTAARREVLAKLKTLNGKGLKLKEEIAVGRSSGAPLQETLDESSKADRELQEVREELGKTGRIETTVSKLLDTRVSDVRGFLAGQAGPGRHVAGSTPKDLQEAAGAEPGALEKFLEFGDGIPVVDVGSTLLGTAVGRHLLRREGRPVARNGSGGRGHRQQHRGGGRQRRGRPCRRGDRLPAGGGRRPGGHRRRRCRRLRGR
jgi:uncharacterized protein YukE